MKFVRLSEDEKVENRNLVQDKYKNAFVSLF